MDFANRTQQPAAPAHAGAGATRKGSADNNKWNRIATVVLAALVGVVLLFAIVSLAGNKGSKESGLVDSSKLQAVFLNTGQVYFGNVKELNSKYFVLTNIYYLQTASNGQTGQNANTSVSLVKLGCELHEPFDKMVINRDQVTFWENLQDGGQVAKAVTTFEKQNPNGQKCADQSSASSTNSGNNAQPAGTTNTNNNSTTNP
jgi:hypothetical protein